MDVLSHRLIAHLANTAKSTLIPAVLLLSLFAVAQGETLFQSDAPLEITIEMPLKTLIRRAKEKPEIPGLIQFRGDDGKTVSIDMVMTTRGRSRLDYCQFPPLKIDLDKSQAKGTIFEGQNKLKIVTHCKDGDIHQRYLEQEFGIYKAYNQLSDFSFRARWLTVHYKDSDNDGEVETHNAFFIESDRELAARHGLERVEQNKISSAILDPVESSRYAMFQYLIANTDWSMLLGPADEGCCHNGKVLKKPGADDGYIVVPYDFDQSGLMNTRYAMPADALNIRSVRQRLYRGRCRHNDQLESAIALFNEKRAVMEKYLLPESLPPRLRNTTSTYIDAFYKIVNDPDDLQRQVIDACIGP